MGMKRCVSLLGNLVLRIRTQNSIYSWFCDQPSLCSQWFVVNGSGRVASACLSVYALQFLSLCNAFCSCAIYQQGIGAHSSCEQVDTSCLVFDNAGYRACDLWNSIVDTQTFFASAVENAERGTVDF